MSPLTLRRYLLDGQPATWSDFAAVNEPEVMAELGALEPGQSTILGMCDHVERLPDAPFGFVLVRHLSILQRRHRIVCVGPDDVGAYTGLDIGDGASLEQRAQVWAATSVDELRALPFVLG